jgi:hypothetical protein
MNVLLHICFAYSVADSDQLDTDLDPTFTFITLRILILQYCYEVQKLSFYRYGHQWRASVVFRNVRVRLCKEFQETNFKNKNFPQ